MAHFRLAAAALLVALQTPAGAVGPSIDIFPSFVALGAGVTTEWLGARETVAGVAPAARKQFPRHRFIEVYGALVDANVLDSPNWEFGPMLQYRFGREDVEDEVVNRLPAIDGGLEAGLFGDYHYVNLQGIPWRLRLAMAVTTGVSGDATGTHVTPYASFWMPLGRRVFAGVGLGATWSSASFMHQRFGVTPAAAAASGLPAYSAGAGLRQLYFWPALVVQLEERWFAGVGGFYQRLTGDAAASPIVAERGTRHQWSAGGGIGYLWR